MAVCYHAFLGKWVRCQCRRFRLDDRAMGYKALDEKMVARTAALRAKTK